MVSCRGTRNDSLDPFNKSLYLFCGERRDRIKRDVVGGKRIFPSLQTSIWTLRQEWPFVLSTFGNLALKNARWFKYFLELYSEMRWWGFATGRWILHMELLRKTVSWEQVPESLTALLLMQIPMRMELLQSQSSSMTLRTTTDSYKARFTVQPLGRNSSRVTEDFLTSRHTSKKVSII